MNWTNLIPGVFGLIEKLIPDPQAAAEAKLETMRLAQSGQFKELDTLAELARQQTQINALEAQQGTFRGGWRPFIGWVCGAGLAYQFLARPLLPWVAQVAGLNVPPMPALDSGEIYPLIFGMLGLGGLRTFERVKGSA
jgi:hypothetical protein